MIMQYWVYFPFSGRIGKVDRSEVNLLVERFPQYIYFEALASEVER